MLFQISSLQMRTLLNDFKGLRERSPQKTENLKTRKPENLKTMQNQDSPACLLYTSEAADEKRGVDLGGRRII